MHHRVRIDIVADLGCPWSAIGVAALLQGLDTLRGEITADVHWQPFELNPGMGPQGEEQVAFQQQRFGNDLQRQQQTWALIRECGQAVGLDMGVLEGRRTYNTFDAHRLLEWAHGQGADRQLALAQHLIRIDFAEHANIADHQVLAAAAAEVGLDPAAVRAVLASDEAAQSVRDAQAFYLGSGIRSAPTFIVNHRHLISGGQPPEVFAEVLRQMAKDAAAA